MNHHQGKICTIKKKISKNNLKRQIMNSYCKTFTIQKKSRWLRRFSEFLAWIFPSALLVLIPKCPACLAAYITFWTGLGLSFSIASYLRLGLISICIALISLLIFDRLWRQKIKFNLQNKEIKQCQIK